MITFTKKNFLSGLPNLGAQISCAQSWYTTVQIDLKYPPAYATRNLHTYLYTLCKISNLQLASPAILGKQYFMQGQVVA